jgi:hypothetical protein
MAKSKNMLVLVMAAIKDFRKMYIGVCVSIVGGEMSRV